MAESYYQEFVQEYTSCVTLRNQTTRMSKPVEGSSNIAETGHPQNAGIIDKSTLCVFRPKNDVCTGQRTQSAKRQREVQKQTVASQQMGFRSVEHRLTKNQQQNQMLQQARCASLINSA